MAGLAKKGMKDAIPASYIRWLNKRVATYLDHRNEDEREEGGSDGDK
jgi:hypothetical protein